MCEKLLPQQRQILFRSLDIHPTDTGFGLGDGLLFLCLLFHPLLVCIFLRNLLGLLHFLDFLLFDIFLFSLVLFLPLVFFLVYLERRRS